jgi:hypothetical protein
MVRGTDGYWSSLNNAGLVTWALGRTRHIPTEWPNREKLPNTPSMPCWSSSPWCRDLFSCLSGCVQCLPKLGRRAEMTKPPKRPRDLNQWAKHMVDLATGAAQEVAPSATNQAAAELGRKGGRKGGLARAKNMTKAQRSASARKAAQARWRKILSKS